MDNLMINSQMDSIQVIAVVLKNKNSQQVREKVKKGHIKLHKLFCSKMPLILKEKIPQ